MKVLFVTSEAAPFKKFGGLGDFSGSLPKALENLGIDVDLILPYYKDIKLDGLKVYKSLELGVEFDGKTYTTEIYKTKIPGSNVDVILPKAELKFTGDFLSDVEFFSFFDKAVVAYIESQYNTYDIVHCNDWHTGFITHLLEDELEIERPKTLLTIHNLAYQGVSTPELVKEMGFVPGEHPLIDWDIEDGDINMLQQAITSSDYLNTVSRTYAKELLTKEFSGDFVDIMNQRQDRLVGILNGIDYESLPKSINVMNWKDEKINAKRRVLQELGLAYENKPVFSYISRLDPGQKGLDILFDSLPHILEKGGQFVLLGTGDPIWEGKLRDFAKESKFKDFMSINITFDVKLAQRIYEGSDFFLVPSKYEPCGLTQMMSMWYGALPIVRSTGGLKDTVQDHVNGFVFDDYTSESLNKSLDDAFKVYEYPAKFGEMIVKALETDFSWDKSANEYKNLYTKILEL